MDITSKSKIIAWSVTKEMEKRLVLLIGPVFNQKDFSWRAEVRILSEIKP